MKPLKILLGNNTLSLLAGSETWTKILALELKSRGHEVSCYSPELGIISDALEKKNIRCYDDIAKPNALSRFNFVLEEKCEHDYDVIIANHFHIVAHLRNKFPKTPIISTIHGIIHIMEGDLWAPEHPALNSDVDRFVSVSEEIEKKMKNEYNLDSHIIRNFFDIKKLSSLRPVNENKPKQFLINTNYNSKEDDVVQIIKEVANHFGAKLSAVGMNFVQTEDLTKPIEDADVVFGMGRSLVEGVAAGRLGIVHGRWGTGGAFIQSNIENLQTFNFSGRNSGGRLATKEELIRMIEEYYHPVHLDWGKARCAEEHNVVFAANAFIRIARDLIEKPKESEVKISKFKLAKDA